MVFSTFLALLYLPSACFVLFFFPATPFPFPFCPPPSPLLVSFRHTSFSRGAEAAPCGSSLGWSAAFLAVGFRLLLLPHWPFPLPFLTASLLTCMSSSVLLWLPRKKASPTLDSPLFLVSWDQQTAFGTPCFQNKDKVSVDLCRFLPVTIYR